MKTQNLIEQKLMSLNDPDSHESAITNNLHKLSNGKSKIENNEELTEKMQELEEK